LTKVNPLRFVDFQVLAVHHKDEEFAYSNVTASMHDGEIISALEYGRNIHRAFAFALKKISEQILEKYPETNEPIHGGWLVDIGDSHDAL
jgi:ribosome-associated translation inhibitor RaiA